MVPTTKLLIWVALVCIPLAVTSALEPSASLPVLVVLAVLLVLVTVDALRSQNHLQGIELEFPDTARFTKNKAASFTWRIKNRSPKSLSLHLGLPWPLSLKPQTEVAFISLPGSSEWSQQSCPCLPGERGLFNLDQVYLQTHSTLGLWAIRESRKIHTEIRVYPSLQQDRRQLAGLFLNRGTLGVHAQRQVGKGREFEKLRDYIPGDGFEDIHWKATAKRGHPVSKVYQVERTQELYLVMDTSRLSHRRTPQSQEATRESHLERYLTAALVLGQAAQKQGDLFGLITFSDQVNQFLRARNGQAHYHACRDSLYQLQSRPVTPDFQELASFIRMRLRRRALLVILTALDDPVLAESFTQSMSLICRQHLVLVNMIQPPEAQPLFSNPDVRNIDDVYHRLGGHLYWSKLKELEKYLHRIGVRFSLVENEQLSVQLVSQYLETKQRQLL